MKTLGILATVLAVSACAPSSVWTAGSANNSYVWVGCHNVSENPAADGSHAFVGPGLDTSVIYFKQLNNDGSMAPVNGTPCD